MVRVRNLMMSILSINEVHLEWEIEGTVSQIKLDVERSDSPESEFEKVGEVDDDELSFSDLSPLTHRKYIPFYYRIKEEDDKYSEVIDMPSEPDKMAIESARTIKRALMRDYAGAGTKCYLFPKKTYGARCPECFNVELNKSVLSDCKTCFGSTYEEGYGSPIEVYIAFPMDQPDHMEIAGGAAYIEMATGRAWTSNYPVLKTEDVLIRDIDKVMFKVGTPIIRSGRRQFITKQTFPFDRIPHNTVEYDLLERVSA